MAEKSSAFCDEGTRYESIEPGKPELPRSRSYVVQVGALGIWRGHGLSPILESRAGSTGRCNTISKFTCRSLKAQSLSRALIEAQSYLVEIGLRVTGQVGFLGEVLS